MIPTDDLGPGEMGYITAAIKTVADCNVGDTITDDRKPSAAERLPGFKPSIPVVWCGLYPGRRRRFRETARKPGQAAAERRQLPLRAGDLRPPWASASAAASSGLLHLEIIQERLSREFDLDLIATAPSVVYRVHRTNGR